MRVGDDDAPAPDAALRWTEWTNGAITADVREGVTIQVGPLWSGGWQVALYIRRRGGGSFEPQRGAWPTREAARAAAEALAAGMRR